MYQDKTTIYVQADKICFQMFDNYPQKNFMMLNISNYTSKLCLDEK